MGFFLRRQRTPGCDAMPFGEAPPATRRGRVLGDKNGMTAHRRLPAVVLRHGRPEPRMDNLAGMTGQFFRRRTINNGLLAAAKPEPHPEWRLSKSGKHQMQRSHG